MNTKKFKSHSFIHRVRYSETDKMGYLYYGHYAKLYEIGRVEWLRSQGISYKDLEDKQGIMLPVVAMECRYKQPAYYDDELSIVTTLDKEPGKMIVFHHEIRNSESVLLNVGVVKLFFVDMESNKRISIPNFVLNAIQ